MTGSMHHTEWVTTFDFPDTDIPIEGQVTSKGPIVIGSEVLVSFESLVLSGVTIHHGAVVAARAVVRDVPPLPRLPACRRGSSATASTSRRARHCCASHGGTGTRNG